jgi:Flp pilus assembly pilin Flp
MIVRRPLLRKRSIMNNFITAAGRFACEEDAPTMVEYGLVLAVVIVPSIFLVHSLGQITVDFFRNEVILAAIR